MRREKIEKAPIGAYFFSFATLGGFCVLLSLSPSPLALFCVLPIFLSSMLALIESTRLCLQGRKTKYHETATALGFFASIPFAFIATFLAVTMLFAVLGFHH